MADPIFWRDKTVLAKPEGTYGVDSTPAAGNAILMTNVSLAPMEGEDVNRNLEQPYFGASEDIPVGLYCTLTGDVELVGSGTAGDAPGWSPLIRACNVAETINAGVSVEYDPISAGGESVAIYIPIGPTRHVMLGTRGTFMIKLNAQGIPVLSFTLSGLFTLPTTETPISPDYSAFQEPQVATNANTPTFTIGGTDFVLDTFELNRAGQVSRRLLIGKEEIVVSNSDETAKAVVEAVGLGTYNPYSIAQDRTKQVIQLVHGTAAGKIVTLDLDRTQQKRVTGFEEKDGVQFWPLDFKVLPTTGNDQWKMTLT